MALSAPDLVVVVPVVALAALLLTAYRQPSRLVELTVAVLAAGMTLAVGGVELDRAGEILVELAPVVAFLAGILVVARVCDRAGLFSAAGQVLRGAGGAGPARLLTATFIVAAVVTAVLSLDTTVVLLTPVAVAAALSLGTSPRPVSYACLRMANSASLLLPVSNLTNLLAGPRLDLTFLGFAAVMAPVLAAVLVVELVLLRVVFRSELRSPTRSAVAPGPEQVTELPRVPAYAVGVMLAGFAITSPLDLEPWWVCAATAVGLGVWGHRRGLIGGHESVRALHLEFVAFVLALGIVVAAISQEWLGEIVTRALPDRTDFLGLLVICLVATALANLFTNLSAALVIVPLVAPLGDVAILAALLGLNIGSGLTLTGSLANLLWRRALSEHALVKPGLVEFHRISFAMTPLSLLVAVTTLAWVT